MTALFPQDVQVMQVNYSDATIHVLMPPSEKFFVKLEEAALAVQVSQESVKEYFRDLPEDLQREYPMLSCQLTLLAPNGTQAIENAVLVPLELVLSFWQLEALQHNRFAIKLTSGMLIRCAIENFENTIRQRGDNNEF